MTMNPDTKPHLASSECIGSRSHTVQKQNPYNTNINDILHIPR